MLYIDDMSWGWCFTHSASSPRDRTIAENPLQRSTKIKFMKAQILLKLQNIVLLRNYAEQRSFQVFLKQVELRDFHQIVICSAISII